MSVQADWLESGGVMLAGCDLARLQEDQDLCDMLME